MGTTEKKEVETKSKEEGDLRAPAREEEGDLRTPAREEEGDLRTPAREEEGDLKAPVRKERNDNERGLIARPEVFESESSRGRTETSIKRMSPGLRDSQLRGQDAVDRLKRLVETAESNRRTRRFV